MQNLLGNPHVTPQQLAQLVMRDRRRRSSMSTAATSCRRSPRTADLRACPRSPKLFDELKDAEEGVVDVTVTSAAPLGEEQQRTLAEALTRRLKREVRLHTDTDPALIGGAVIRAGDLVIDGSLRSRLERIAYELTA